MLGDVDVVMGSFSKTFATNGGFVACKNRAVKEYLRFYSAPATFSNALSPVQAATIMKAFEIVGLSKADVEERFGGMYRAFQYGAPPHGGMAAGVDRVIMLLCGTIGWLLLAIPPMVIGVIAFIEFIIYLVKPDAEFHRDYVAGNKSWF